MGRGCGAERGELVGRPTWDQDSCWPHGLSSEHRPSVQCPPAQGWPRRPQPPAGDLDGLASSPALCHHGACRGCRPAHEWPGAGRWAGLQAGAFM